MLAGLTAPDRSFIMSQNQELATVGGLHFQNTWHEGNFSPPTNKTK